MVVSYGWQNAVRILTCVVSGEGQVGAWSEGSAGVRWKTFRLLLVVIVVVVRGGGVRGEVHAARIDSLIPLSPEPSALESNIHPHMQPTS